MHAGDFNLVSFKNLSLLGAISENGKVVIFNFGYLLEFFFKKKRLFGLELV